MKANTFVTLLNFFLSLFFRFFFGRTKVNSFLDPHFFKGCLISWKTSCRRLSKSWWMSFTFFPFSLTGLKSTYVLFHRFVFFKRFHGVNTVQKNMSKSQLSFKRNLCYYHLYLQKMKVKFRTNFTAAGQDGCTDTKLEIGIIFGNFLCSIFGRKKKISFEI